MGKIGGQTLAFNCKTTHLATLSHQQMDAAAKQPVIRTVNIHLTNPERTGATIASTTTTNTSTTNTITL